MSQSADKQFLGTAILTALTLGGLVYLDQKNIRNKMSSYEREVQENFGNVPQRRMISPTSSPVPTSMPVPRMAENPQFYGNSNSINTGAFTGPSGGIPQNRTRIDLTASGDQLLEYQLYQQAVNAATPTLAQLNSISGESQQQTGNTPLKGGVSSQFGPYNVLSSNGSPLYDSEYQAVNYNNPRAESISACAQNAPTFIATSLLPKPTIPGQQSWDINAQGALVNQNFLSASQQLGIDTVSSSLRNPSYDIRNNIPNPISVVSPWNNTTILPDLERRPLDCFIPQEGLYGCSSAGGCNTNGTFVGK